MENENQASPHLVWPASCECARCKEQEKRWAAERELPARKRAFRLCDQGCGGGYLAAEMQQVLNQASTVVEAALKADPEFHRAALEELLSLFNKKSETPTWL